MSLRKCRTRILATNGSATGRLATLMGTQRVSEERALKGVGQQKRLVMHELLVGLGAKLHGAMEGQVCALQVKPAATTIYATPDQIGAVRMADCAIAICGRKQNRGEKRFGIYKRPASLFIDGLLRDVLINLLPQTTERQGVSDGHERVAYISIKVPEASSLNGGLSLAQRLDDRPPALTRRGSVSLSVSDEKNRGPSRAKAATVPLNPIRPHLFDMAMSRSLESVA